jgi:superfamily I DNA and/or RNA helicase
LAANAHSILRYCRFGATCKFSHGGDVPLPDGFFQRVEKALRPVPALTEQYRMHPAICTVVSKCFYSGTLVTPRCVADARRKADEHGMWWFDSIGSESKRHNSTSTQNEIEANDVLEVYKRELGRPRAGSVMIITFYKAQLHVLCDLFAEHGYNETSQLRIVTVDQSQGSEADIVILSTVRSNNRNAIGFLKNPNRLNVAISRARERLVIVGNRSTVAHGTNGEWPQIAAACKPL